MFSHCRFFKDKIAFLRNQRKKLREAKVFFRKMTTKNFYKDESSLLHLRNGIMPVIALRELFTYTSLRLNARQFNNRVYIKENDHTLDNEIRDIDEKLLTILRAGKLTLVSLTPQQLFYVAGIVENIESYQQHVYIDRYGYLIRDLGRRCLIQREFTQLARSRFNLFMQLFLNASITYETQNRLLNLLDIDMREKVIIAARNYRDKEIEKSLDKVLLPELTHLIKKVEAPPTISVNHGDLLFLSERISKFLLEKLRSLPINWTYNVEIHNALFTLRKTLNTQYLAHSDRNFTRLVNAFTQFIRDIEHIARECDKKPTSSWFVRMFGSPPENKLIFCCNTIFNKMIPPHFLDAIRKNTFIADPEKYEPLTNKFF